MTRYIEPPSNLNEIIDLYSKHGQTLLSLEKTTGYARNSLRQWFKKEGVKLKSHRQASTEANKRDAAVLPEKDSFIKDFGIMNLKELQEKYSIGQETLYKWMKIYDLKKSFSESVSKSISSRVV
jgi:transposase